MKRPPYELYAILGLECLVIVSAAGLVLFTLIHLLVS